MAHVQTLCPQPATPFGKGVEPLEGEAWLEEMEPQDVGLDAL